MNELTPCFISIVHAVRERVHRLFHRQYRGSHVQFSGVTKASSCRHLFNGDILGVDPRCIHW